MNVVLLAVLFVLSVLAQACGSPEVTAPNPETVTPTRHVYVWVQGLDLRQGPTATSAVLGPVPQGERLALLAGRSQERTPVAIGEAFASDAWYEVRRSDNRTGWVHGAGLRMIPVATKPDAPRIDLDLSRLGPNVLVGGFTPQTRVVDAGGAVQASVFQPGCGGFVSESPTVTFNYQLPSPLLRIYVESAADTVLLVRRPDGSVVCIDDTVDRHPLLDFATPSPGEYQVWAGSYRPGTVAAQVVIAETRSVGPGR